MSASVVTFANIGRKANLRTTDMLPLLEALSKAGELKQVICPIDEGSAFPQSIQAVPEPFRYAIRLFEKLTRPFSRLTTDRIFDTGAALRLRKADVTMLHGSNTLPKTVRRAHELGSLTVGISVSANLAANVALEKEELTKLGFPEYEGVYAWIARTSSPPGFCDYEVLMSDFGRQTYLDAGLPAERTFIATLDVDTERFKPVQQGSRGNRPFRALYLAHTTPLKGLHYLLDAWESLKLSEAELQIIGGFAAMPDALEQQYRAHIKRDPSITWLPATSTPEQFYRDASVLVFPSLTEGFGRTTLEAMACGIPVITTEHAQGIVEDSKSGFVVPVRDAGAIADKIRYLYDHPDIAHEMGKEARREVENKKPFGEAMLEIYREIMRRENRPRTVA